MPIGRLLVTMSVPMMISMFIQALYNVVDSMFVARLSEDALTAVSMAFPVQNIMIALAVGTGVGVNALVSRSLGEGNLRRAEKAANVQIFLDVCYAVLSLVAGLFFVVSVFFFTFIIAHKPDPRMVFYKQINYKLEDGRNIKRDSTPILEEDFGFYYLQDPYMNQTYEMNDLSIEHLTDFYAYQYFNYLKKLDLSDNFYENYDAVLTKWRLWVIAWGLVALASLIGAMCALFIKESNRQVGVMRGEGWK